MGCRRHGFWRTRWRSTRRFENASIANRTKAKQTSPLLVLYHQLSIIIIIGRIVIIVPVSRCGM
jgi:hypothetical protein